ncbi:hypothetical protein GIB67_013154 [Kingdonia uniflora]|uniref:PGG domain-containing protein n=1 Tax=Kingdonia uniflora TaxID=39325 RepID=A0A7J7LCP4_9MAGN|nr:hypothetical protein GIB67_013154 [Kingdonia uniflora]
MKKRKFKFFELGSNSVEKIMATSIQIDQISNSKDIDHTPTPTAQNISNTKKKDLSFYTPVYKAAFEGEWKKAESFFELNPGSVDAAISGSGKTALHIAAASGQSFFVKQLVKYEMMTEKMLEKRDNGGHTALYFAVAAGNLKAAKAMVKRNSKLPQMQNNNGQSPILEAALLGNRDLLKYLYENTADEMSYPGQDPSEASPFRGESGLKLLNAIIAADFYDIALDLVRLHPEVATIRLANGNGISALDVLARRSSSFESGTKLGFWQHRIYPFVRVTHTTPEKLRPGSYLDTKKVLDSITEETESPNQASREVDLESQKPKSVTTFKVSKKSLKDGKDWAFMIKIMPVSFIMEVHRTKLMHYRAEKLAQCICIAVSGLEDQAKISDLVNMPFLDAAESGAVEFISACLRHFPALMWIHYKSHTILHYCIINRQEKVFKLLHHKRIRACQNSLAAYQDQNGNTILHLAAKLAPPEKLKAVSGAALQMQREIQWYKAVEEITKPTYRELKNNEEEEHHTLLEWKTNSREGGQQRPQLIPQKKMSQYTPWDLFVKEHKELVAEGEKWMRELSSSCSVVATLIATMVFAAAFTVPGGNDQNKGTPLFLQSRYYMLFAISDALALISSLTSVLIFLSALTSRYAEVDFLVSLPRKLIIGLATLFFSIATMAIAFSATYFIMFSTHFAWLAIMVASFICFPAVLFAVLQFPLFFEVVRSTYGSSVLHRQS